MTKGKSQYAYKQSRHLYVNIYTPMLEMAVN